MTRQFFENDFLKILIVIVFRIDDDEKKDLIVKVDADTRFLHQGFRRIFNFGWSSSFSMYFDDVIRSSNLLERKLFLVQKSMYMYAT